MYEFHPSEWRFVLQRKPPMVVDDLFEDMKDGVKLLALLEVLSGQKLVRIFSDHTCSVVSIYNDRIVGQEDNTHRRNFFFSNY